MSKKDIFEIETKSDDELSKIKKNRILKKIIENNEDSLQKIYKLESIVVSNNYNKKIINDISTIKIPLNEEVNQYYAVRLNISSLINRLLTICLEKELYNNDVIIFSIIETLSDYSKAYSISSNLYENDEYVRARLEFDISNINHLESEVMIHNLRLQNTELIEEYSKDGIEDNRIEEIKKIVFSNNQQINILVSESENFKMRAEHTLQCLSLLEQK